jgi:uncharacterized protein YcgI (DUF1989 family)
MSPSLHTIPARRGKAMRLSAGEAIRIINTHGAQVVDTWAFSADDMSEFMSMEHIRPTLGRIFPTAGDALVTNRRRPILMFEEDSSMGRHDTLIAACDDYHDNCTDNLHAALRQLGHKSPETPSPLNLWMNIPVDPEGCTSWGTPLSKPGDYVVLRAVMDCVVAMSACPQDILPINGAACVPTEAHFEILGR